jgi:hypothetical protein
MGLLNRTRPSAERRVIAPTTADRAMPTPATRNVRHSNGLKDFLWLVGDAQQGRILDLGPVWQSTVSFFTERGFKVYTEDLLRAWKQSCEEKERERAARPEAAFEEPDRAALAEQFLEENLIFSPQTFHGVLAWDMFDYLEGQLLPRVVARLFDVLKPGGVLLAAFHSSRPSESHRYRILDQQTVELIPAPVSYRAERLFQNRELLELFSRFNSSRTFVGRDQLREGLFTK